MKFYQVGGCIRDTLLGIEPNDIDYVVCGSTPQEMLSKGFTEVGANFPVFLHPVTGDEWALARTEESTGNKYKDFNCYFGEDVTIEDDLSRRDLTINAMALDCSTGELIDPYGGKSDLEHKILRHTSEAFADDSTRVLRLARFYARFGEDWTIAPETAKLCIDMLSKGMLEALTPERIWKETEKALGTKKPSLFFKTLYNFGIFPELDCLYDVPQKLEHHPENFVGIHNELVINFAAKVGLSKEEVWTCALHDLGKAPSYIKYNTAHGHEEEGLPLIRSLCKRIKVPNNYRDLALLVCKFHTKIHGCMGRNTNDWMRPKSIYKLFQETNALAKPERFEKILNCCIADASGRGATPEQIKEFEDKPYPQKEYLLDCLNAVKSLDTKPISAKILAEGKKDGKFIGEQIRVSRINEIRGVQQRWKNKKKI